LDLRGTNKIMGNDRTDEIKVEKPHLHFDAPHEVIADPTLTKDQKVDALSSLEQDARQLAIASAEGMSGGEDTALQEVLHAKDALELHPVAYAYEVVLKDLQLRQKGSKGEEMQGLVEQAIAALEAIKKAEKASSP
jgi:hypothetical protein